MVDFCNNFIFSQFHIIHILNEANSQLYKNNYIPHYGLQTDWYVKKTAKNTQPQPRSKLKRNTQLFCLESTNNYFKTCRIRRGMSSTKTKKTRVRTKSPVSEESLSSKKASPPSKTRIKTAATQKPPQTQPTSGGSISRYESSLSLLTQKFTNLIQVCIFDRS